MRHLLSDLGVFALVPVQGDTERAEEAVAVARHLMQPQPLCTQECVERGQLRMVGTATVPAALRLVATTCLATAAAALATL
eukprot:5184816-Pleurochrysis_carterae.AAC.1